MSEKDNGTDYEPLMLIMVVLAEIAMLAYGISVMAEKAGNCLARLRKGIGRAWTRIS